MNGPDDHEPTCPACDGPLTYVALPSPGPTILRRAEHCERCGLTQERATEVVLENVALDKHAEVPKGYIVIGESVRRLRRDES
jgi:hypothetical protein